MADWSLLPNELVERISTFLDTAMDLLRFRSVCSSWRSSASPNSRALCPSLFNELNYPPLGCPTRRTVFLITPAGSTSPCSNGWLVKINSEEGSPKHLVHPLSQHRLNSLPTGFPRHLDLFNFRILELGQEYAGLLNLRIPTYLKKVVITLLNRGSHFLLLARDAIGILAFYESVGKKWTIFNDVPQRYTNDVIAYKEKLYAVYNDGKTVCVGPNAELELIAYPIFEGGDKYLVECRGQLLLVNMYRDTNINITCRCRKEALWKNPTCYVCARVFKLDKESRSWIVLNCLDDQVLFLGQDSHFSASASDLPGCMGNCIFFSNGYLTCEKKEVEAGVLLGNNSGVFGFVGLLSKYPEYAKMFWPPPDWVSSMSSEEQTQNQLADLPLIEDDPALELH